VLRVLGGRRMSKSRFIEIVTLVSNTRSTRRMQRRTVRATRRRRRTKSKRRGGRTLLGIFMYIW